MAARCASCSYPLTIIDSIACNECSSYFHIDCAQLVGFPYYELSSDPSRNTFHCATCELLPLPIRRSDSDSDIEADATMPSRQLDYQLEGDGDLAKDMNEIKGSVQDISELCKNMLREINELKAVNLTLRCCIENLRHDNEQRDCVIAELKNRLATLESLRSVSKTNTFVTDWGAERTVGDKEEEAERYLTPEPETSKIDETDASVSKSTVSDGESEILNKQDELSYSDSLQENLNEEEAEKTSESKKYDFDVENNLIASNIEKGYFECETKTKKEHEIDNDDKPSFGFNVNKEKNAEELIDTQQRRRDWDWKGTKAVEVNKAEENEESDEEESGSESSEVEEEDARGWEILDEEIQSKTFRNPVEYSTESVDEHFSASSKDEEEDEETEKEDEFWAKGTKTHDSFHDWGKEVSESYEPLWSAQDTESVFAQKEPINEFHAVHRLKGEEAGDTARSEQGTPVQDIPEEGADSAEKEDLAGPIPTDGEGEKLPEGVEIAVTGEGETISSGEPHPEGEGTPRLEGEDAPKPESEETPRPEGEPGVEGGQLGGQSPEEGEVQPTEPLPPPPPEHSEEDLWLYLKETVTSVHPSTVEEFVQNLIGTLQQVPEEYLKPVIQANIKRATSPFVTDEEHLQNQEGVPLTDGQEAHLAGSAPVEGETSATGDVVQVTSDAGEETQPKMPPEVPEELRLPEEASEGFSAVEGALCGAFWVVWILYTLWET